ncbi:MAG: non-homologous end-joining DNA ligase [Actinomycetota bacterium]
MTKQFLEMDGEKVEVSNLNKIFWAKEGILKAHLMKYYIDISPYLLPHLKDRPLTLHPYPDGIDGPSFFVKNCPEHAPPWLETWLYHSEDGETINFCLANDLKSLVWLANQACIEFHPWFSRTDKPDCPDFAIFDLDPFPPATFHDTIEIAHLIKRVLDEFELKSFIKTSGATGLHIYVPIERKFTYEDTRNFATRVSYIIHRVYPEKVCMEWNVEKRRDIRIDYTQNAKGKTLASPYSLRPLEGAPVSTPIAWEELKEGLNPKRFNIFTILNRLKKVGDLFKPTLELKQDITEVLGTFDKRRQAIMARKMKTKAIPITEKVKPAFSVRFGPSGLPDRKNLEKSMSVLKERGYSACEIEFVRGFYLNEKQCKLLGELTREAEIYLSVHAPYFAVLSREEPKKREQALNVLQHTAHLAMLMGVPIMVVHAGFLLGRDKAKVSQIIKDNIAQLNTRLLERGYMVKIGIENTGKLGQFGQLGDLLGIIKTSKNTVPAIDLAHIHATTGGSLTSKENFKLVFKAIRDALGEEFLHPLHVHFTDVSYGKRGEIEHISYGQGELRLQPLLEAVREMGIDLIIISEAREADSTLRMKGEINRFLQDIS